RAASHAGSWTAGGGLDFSSGRGCTQPDAHGETAACGVSPGAGVCPGTAGQQKKKALQSASSKQETLSTSLRNPNRRFSPTSGTRALPKVFNSWLPNIL